MRKYGDDIRFFSNFDLEEIQFQSLFYYALGRRRCLADKHRKAVVTLKIYNRGLDRICATHFDPSPPLFGFLPTLWEPLS